MAKQNILYIIVQMLKKGIVTVFLKKKKFFKKASLKVISLSHGLQAKTEQH